jgi:hypothetical protein
MEKVTAQELVEFYDDMLDQYHENAEVTICGYTYAPSYALKSLDPIAYNTGLDDFADGLMRDGSEVEGY